MLNKCIKSTRYTNPARTSTNGYCQDILLLQLLHLPLKKKKLTTGKSSYQDSVFPQEKHWDLPCKVNPVFILKITTFKKLPIIVPKTNTNRYKIFMSKTLLELLADCHIRHQRSYTCGCNSSTIYTPRK